MLWYSNMSEWKGYMHSIVTGGSDIKWLYTTIRCYKQFYLPKVRQPSLWLQSRHGKKAKQSLPVQHTCQYTNKAINKTQ